MKGANMRWSVLAVAILALTGCGYNRIQSLDEQANGFKSQIEVQLQRRADLVPNLVETVKGYAKQEQTVFGEVAEARAKLSGAVQGGDLSQMANANQNLTGALGRLIAISEAYPQLKSNENFLALQTQLEGTENRIAVERQRFNTTVQTYNTTVRRFPESFIAGLRGFHEKAYFTAKEGAENAPAVQF